MKSVIYINKEKEQDEKPVELTHCLDSKNGWTEAIYPISYFNEIIYLGNCHIDGDMFCCKTDKGIHIFKGHLNSGKY